MPKIRLAAAGATFRDETGTLPLLAGSSWPSKAAIWRRSRNRGPQNLGEVEREHARLADQQPGKNRPQKGELDDARRPRLRSRWPSLFHLDGHDDPGSLLPPHADLWQASGDRGV